MFLFLERRNIMSRKKLVSICALVVLLTMACGIVEANWSEDFNDMTFDQTWQWYCIQDVTKTFTHTIQDGPGSNDFLVLSEPLSVDVNGSAFGMGIGSQEEFTDVRLGAVLNADGQASSSKQSIYAISGRTQYFNHPGGGGVLPYPGVYASGYALLMSWENAPARLEIEVQKYICLSSIMSTSFIVQIPGADPDKSYYAVLDIVGSNPVYVTGSLYEYKGGPLVARTPTLIDTDLKDWWEDADDTDTFWIVDVKVFPITNFMDKNYRKSGIGVLNEDPTPPGYRVTFDDVSSISNGPAAVNLSPADGATGVSLNADLSWKEAAFATSRDLWFGKAGKMQKVTPSPAGKTYDPGTLELGKTYQWQVDEIGPPTVTGYLWSFTTIPCLVVDDFEKYTNSDPNIIYKTWKDGLGYSPGNGTGSQAGYRAPDYAEVTVVHEGKQSLPVDYNNAKLPYYSEVDRTFDTPQDWTAYGVKALTLWLRGYPSVPPGTFVESPLGTYTMTASGTDIGDVPDLRKPSKFHDEFRYAYIQVSGNYAIAVKVESITDTDAWAKAGVMIRDSLDANSMHVMACITPTSGISFQYRATAGGGSTSSTQTGLTVPYWIVLERAGDSFTAYYSPTGAQGSWTLLGSTTITMPDPVYIGLSLTAHNAAATCTSVFSNVMFAPPTTPSWTSRDIGIKSNTAAPLYVTLQDSGQKSATVTYKDPNNNVDPNIVLTTTWQPLDIALKDFADVNDVNLAAIKKITIGIGNRSAPQAGGIGTIYVDDIRLYPTRCIPDRIKGDLNNDCFPDYTDLDILADNWLTPGGVSSGLKGEYWYTDGGGPPTNAWVTLMLTRTDLTVDFGWGTGVPDPSMRADDFAVRWTGQVKPLYSETYTFTTNTDDGARLWVNNQLVVDWWFEQGATDHSGTISLQAGTEYPIRFEYYENGGDAVARLYWQSASQARQIIPSDRLSSSKAKIADINKDGTVDFRDYAFLAEKWLEEILWP
jgi:hypothetical protein